MAGTERMVVTGGAGFIGSHLCDALVERGHDVTCVDNLVGTRGSVDNVVHLLGNPRFRLVAEDLVTWAQGADLGGVRCVFHLAASKNSVCEADPELDLAVNALATLRLARAAAAAGVGRLVLSSTGSVFGETQGRHGEDVPKAPVSYYGTSKLAGESYCRLVGARTGLDVAILRYYHVIGPRQDASPLGGVVPIFARHALAGEPLTIHGDGEQTRSFTSVHDAVRANLIALDDPAARGATLTCASGVQVTVNELAAYVLEQTGSTVGAVHAPARVGEITRFEVDNGELRRMGLDFDTDWRAVVRDVIATSAAQRAA